MTLEWGAQQVSAIDRVGRWLKEKDKPYFQLAGYAGTGKTTLARHLAESVSTEGAVYFAAYTGKAAHVLQKAGCVNVSTIHKLIYAPKEKSKQRLKDLEAEKAKLLTHKPPPLTLIEKVEKAIRMEMTNLSRPSFQLNSESPLIGARLLVVDEYSMVSEQMGEDLLSFGCPILFLGDPGQLPPVGGNPFLKGQPDVMLTDIRRQAKENPIIWMATEVREGRRLAGGAYGESSVRAANSMAREDIAQLVLDCDQLLVGRNATRISSNSRARELLGRTDPLPQEGDKLVCLRNDHETGLLNGQLWTCRTDSIFDGDYSILNIVGEEGQKLEVISHPQYFTGGKPDYWARKDAQEFDYGYALTVHKSQGSQFPTVLLFDEWHKEDRRQWLYTAITRAAEKIDVITM